MSPTPVDVRKERIQALYSEFKDKHVDRVDPILKRAVELYPYVRKRTVEDYAAVVYSLTNDFSNPK